MGTKQPWAWEKNRDQRAMFHLFGIAAKQNSPRWQRLEPLLTHGEPGSGKGTDSTLERAQGKAQLGNFVFHALRTSQTIKQITNNVPSIPYPNTVPPIECR